MLLSDSMIYQDKIIYELHEKILELTRYLKENCKLNADDHFFLDVFPKHVFSRELSHITLDLLHVHVNWLFPVSLI